MNIIYQDITLRAIEEHDLTMLQEMMNDPVIEKMIVGSSFPISMFQQQKWFENLHSKTSELRLVIETEMHGSIGIVILSDIDYRNGTANFHAKIGSQNKYRGMGYGTKAYKAMIDYAFNQLNLNCIVTANIDYNKITEHIKSKLGFKQEGVLRNRVFKDGKYHNIVVWSLLKADWLTFNS